MAAMRTLFTKLGIKPYGLVGSFHQQNSEQTVDLSDDGAHSLLASRRRLAGDQAQVAGYLFAAGEAFDIPDGQQKAKAVTGPTPGCVINNCT